MSNRTLLMGNDKIDKNAILNPFVTRFIYSQHFHLSEPELILIDSNFTKCIPNSDGLVNEISLFSRENIILLTLNNRLL